MRIARRGLLVAFALSACAGDIAEPRLPILWPATDAYAERVASLPVSEEAAFAKLQERWDRLPDRYFSRTPFCLIGDDYYFYTELSKRPVPIAGYFVDGRTGAIEYRKSPIVLEPQQNALPENAFVEVVRIE
jgi:hypothetical protein